MRHQPTITAPHRHSPRLATMAAWILAILVLMFSLAGCDHEHQHLSHPEKAGATEFFDAAPMSYCAGSESPDEKPHARHMPAGEIAIAGSDAPKTRLTVLEQTARAPLEDIGSPAENLSSTVPFRLPGGRDILTRFCIARR